MFKLTCLKCNNEVVLTETSYKAIITNNDTIEIKASPFYDCATLEITCNKCGNVLGD